MWRNCASEQEKLDRKCNEHTLTQSLFVVISFFLISLKYLTEFLQTCPSKIHLQEKSNIPNLQRSQLNCSFLTHFQPWNKQITFPFFQRPSKSVNTFPEFQMLGLKKQQQQHLISSLQHEQCQACSLSLNRLCSVRHCQTLEILKICFHAAASSRSMPTNRSCSVGPYLKTRERKYTIQWQPHLLKGNCTKEASWPEPGCCINIYLKKVLFCFKSELLREQHVDLFFYQWRGKLMTHLILWPHMLTLLTSLIELIYADCWAQNGSTQSCFPNFQRSIFNEQDEKPSKRNLLRVHFLLYIYIYFLLMGPMMLLWFGSPIT